MYASAHFISSKTLSAFGETLFVFGFFETDGGSFPLLDLQAELMARLLRARRAVPARGSDEQLRAQPTLRA